MQHAFCCFFREGSVSEQASIASSRNKSARSDTMLVKQGCGRSSINERPLYNELVEASRNLRFSVAPAPLITKNQRAAFLNRFLFLHIALINASSLLGAAGLIDRDSERGSSGGHRGREVQRAGSHA
jgi:hypothetical protein